ncbi:Glycosyltransferase involved in cell wall bisynthesis [Micrococcales bacterium KH10]|nr:Glycosyltransferase involved in cell wall bisynthesis [Micrococcales bacterium KH10]
MHIALVTDYYLPTLGGVQTAVKAHAETLRAAGHEVTVFCPLAGPSGDPGVVALPISRFFRPDGYPFTWPPRKAVRLLRDEFARRRIDVVHTHAEMFAALAGIRAAQELGIALVHTMHGRIDVYTANVLPLPALTTHILGWLHRRQVSHLGIEIKDEAAYTQTRAARAMWRLMLAQSRASDHVIVPSEHFRAKLADQGVATPMTVLSNGLEDSVLTQIGQPAPRRLTAGEPLRLLWVGRISPEKRPEVFVRAMAALGGSVTADMYGDGVARRELSRAPGGVRLHGSVPQAEILQAMSRAHALVSTSYDFDNQPMVMLEAIASGLPIIFCDPDLGEVVPDEAGFLTPSPDTHGLVAAVTAILDDPAAIARASQAAIQARSRAASNAAGLEQVYEAAIRAAAARPRNSSH